MGWTPKDRVIGVPFLGGDGQLRSFAEIGCVEDAWQWLEQALVPTLFPAPTKQPTDGRLSGSSVMHTNQLVGDVGLVLRRVRKYDHSSCPSQLQTGDPGPWVAAAHCWPAYAEGTRHTQPFGPSHGAHGSLPSLIHGACCSTVRLHT